MALTPITRFDDPYEGLIAASALNAAGIAAICHADGLSGIEFYLRQATFGSGLWVQEEDVASARAFLAEHRSFEPSALTWTQHSERWRGAPLAALAAIDAGFAGWLIVGAKVKPTPMRLGAVAVVFLLYALTILSVVTNAVSIGLPL